MSIVYAQKNLLATTGFPSTVEILLAGLDTVSFQLAGTWTGTVVFESTTDGNTYAALSVTPSTGAAAVTSATGNGIWAADGCAGFYSVRARCSVFGSGVIVASAGAGANSVAAVANASDGQVLFMDGTTPTGDSGLSYDSGAQILTTFDVEAQQFILVKSDSTQLLNISNPSGDTVEVFAQSAGKNIWFFDPTDALYVGDTGLPTEIDGQNVTIGAGAGGVGTITLFGNTVIGNGKAIHTDTTTGHTATVQAYDVDGAAYKTFITLTNGNTPDCTIAVPAGATLVIQASTYKSSDGSSGVTAGPFTTISSITVKNGIVTALTGS